jgi:hypothetical protein
MGGSSCGFDRAFSRPAKVFKDAKKAAVYYTSRFYKITYFLVPESTERLKLVMCDDV